MNTDNKGILKNGFFSTVQIVISSISYILIYYLVISKLGKEDLGAWAIIASIPAALTVFGSGVSGCLLRYIPVYISQGDIKQFNGIIFNGIIFNVIIALILAGAGYLFSPIILKLLLSNNSVPELYSRVFHTTLLTFFINFVSSVFLYSLDGLQLIYKKNIIITASSVVFCISSAIFISAWGLMGLIYAQIMQAGIVLILSAYVLSREKFFNIPLLRLSANHLKLFLTYGQSFQYISFSILIFEPLTKFFLNKYFNLSTVAMYEIVNRMVTQVRSVIVSAVQVIVPVVSKQNEEKTLNVNELYGKAIRGSTLLSALCYSTLISLVIPVVFLLDPLYFHYYLIFLILLSTASVCNVLCSPAYSIFMGLGNLKNIVISHVLSTSLNVGLFILLQFKPIPELMIGPPVIATFVSSLFVIHQFKKQYGIPFPVCREDNLLYILMLTFVFLSFVFYKFSSGLTILIISAAIHLLTAGYFLFTNSFLAGIKGKLLQQLRV